MASITIRRLDEETKRRLRLAAAANGHSMEEEARRARVRQFSTPAHPEKGLGTCIHELFSPLGGVELEPMPRTAWRPPPDFSSPEYGGIGKEPRRRRG